MVGEGVQLQTEDKVIRPDGTIAAAQGAKNLASDAFVTSFTKKYPEVAAASPIYAQLRGCIDLVVAAALMRKLDFYRQAGWQGATLRNEQQFRTETYVAPVQVPCVVNSFWKGSRLFVPAGGGVSILPDQALEAENLLPDEQNQVGKLRAATLDSIPGGTWWWD